MIRGGFRCCDGFGRGWVFWIEALGGGRGWVVYYQKADWPLERWTCPGRRDVLHNILYLKHDSEYLYIHLSVSLVRCGVDNQRFIH